MAQGNFFFFFFTKHNAKSKGPHMNMIQNFEKLAWEKFQSSFLTEIKVQTWESQTAEMLDIFKAILWIGIDSTLGVNVIVTCQDLGQNI